MARSGIGNAQIGDSYALSSITAAVLGGAALTGGRATFAGALVASVLLALIITALPFLGLNPEYGLIVIGVLVLIGIILYQVGDIKELVKRNYKRARRLVVGSRPPRSVGDLLSALGAIDAGITTLLDWSHVQGSPAHTDAVVQALEDSGLRAVFAWGFPWWGKWEERQPSWFVRAATEHFSTKDQMLTLALAASGPEFTDFEVSRDHWKLARETGARITTRVGVGTYGQDAKVREMGEAGLLGPDTTCILPARPSTTPRSR